MKLARLLFVLALSSFLLLGCSSKKSAETTPTPDTSGTADTGTTVEEGTATGTVDTGTTRTEGQVKKPEDVAPGTQQTPAVEETPSGTPTAGSMGSATNDTQLATAVREKLTTSASPASSGITIVAQGGVVTLNGTVSSQEEADRIIVLVKSVPDVKDVVSNLTVATE